MRVVPRLILQQLRTNVRGIRGSRINNRYQIRCDATTHVAAAAHVQCLQKRAVPRCPLDGLQANPTGLRGRVNRDEER